MYIILTALFLPAFGVQKNVATVNGVSISQKEFEISYQQNKMFFSPRPVTKKKVLDDLINRQLGIQRAKKEKTHKDPIVMGKIDDVIYHAQVSKDLGRELKKIQVSDRDVKRYYQDHKEYRTAHILFRVKINASKKEEGEILKKVISAYKTLEKKPEKFSEMANKHSESTADIAGGDIGFQPSVNLAPEYYNAVKGKKIGEIIPPVRTQFGFHIIKVLGLKEFDGIDMRQYKQILYNQKRDAVIEKYFKRLRKNAKISIDKRYL